MIDSLRTLRSFPGVDTALAWVLARIENNLQVWTDSVRTQAVLRWSCVRRVHSTADALRVLLPGEFILVDTSSGAITLRLPEPTEENVGREVVWRIFAGVNGVVLAPVAGLIDGAASVTFNTVAGVVVSCGAQHGWRSL